MIRVLSVIATISLVGGFLLAILVGGTGGIVAGIVLILIALAIGALLGVRRAYIRAREVVAAVHTFVTGDVRHARIVEVGEPEGLFHPTAETILEVEGDGGHVHRIDVEMPVPFPAALAYRLGRRWNLPIIGRRPLSELMAVELRREGLKMDLGWRPPPDADVTEHTLH